MDACRIGVDNWFRRCFHNCRLQDCRDGSQFGEKQPVRIIVSAGQSVYSPYIRHLLPIAGYQGGSHFLATNWLPPRTGIPRGFPGHGDMVRHEMDVEARFGKVGTIEWE